MKDINFLEINELKHGNMVQYNSNPYTIYDIDNNLIYLKSPDLKNIGIPFNLLRPILLTDNVMLACQFELKQEPETIYIGVDLIQTKTTYELKKNDFGINFKVNVIIDYNEDNNPYLVKTFDKINNNDSSIKYLHQIQNIWYNEYKFQFLEVTNG